MTSTHLLYIKSTIFGIFDLLPTVRQYLAAVVAVLVVLVDLLLDSCSLTGGRRCLVGAGHRRGWGWLDERVAVGVVSGVFGCLLFGFFKRKNTKTKTEKDELMNSQT